MGNDFRTLVFCTSYMAGEADWMSRYQRWLGHHRALPWDAPLFCLIDDGSPWHPEGEVTLSAAGGALPPSPALPLMVRFNERLGHHPGRRYPGWWRSFVHSAAVARHYGCTRIVHIESDAYLLTRRAVQFMAGRMSGWTGLWCPRWSFPETALQVICADRFDAMEGLCGGDWSRFDGQYAERVVPFTDVAREPHGNRYSEFRTRIPGYADFAAQVTPDQAVWFR